MDSHSRKVSLPALVTARMSSSRLPGKHLLEMNGGRTSIACLYDRISATGIDVVLCCADEPADDPLREEASRLGMRIFSGDSENVLLRYKEAMIALNVPAAIIVDADDAFVSTNAMARMLDTYDEHDVIECSGLPYGGAPFLMSRELISLLLEHGVTPNGWARYIGEFGRKREVLEFREIEADPRLRLSLDYPDDLEFLRYLYAHVPFDGVISLEDVAAYVSVHRKELAGLFPGIFDGSIADRAAAHLAAEPE